MYLFNVNRGNLRKSVAVPERLTPPFVPSSLTVSSEDTAAVRFGSRAPIAAKNSTSRRPLPLLWQKNERKIFRYLRIYPQWFVFHIFPDGQVRDLRENVTQATHRTTAWCLEKIVWLFDKTHPNYNWSFNSINHGPPCNILMAPFPAPRAGDRCPTNLTHSSLVTTNKYKIIVCFLCVMNPQAI